MPPHFLLKIVILVLVFHNWQPKNAATGLALPNFEDLKNAYPGYKCYSSSRIKRIIGGNVDAPYIDNTCAVRMSRALNKVGGHDILSPEWDSREKRYDSVRGADKKQYIFRVTGLARYLSRTYKQPTQSSGSDAKDKFQGKKGIMRLVLPGSSSYTGHFALWDGSGFYQSENYLGKATDVYFWETPDSSGSDGGSGGGGGGCFPPLANVIDISKGAMPIKNILVGDKILALTENGKLQYSEVIGWLHLDKDMVVEYYEIYAADGRIITLSGNHIIFKCNPSGVEKSHTFASAIQVGDHLLTKDDANPDSAVIASEVVNITRSWLVGVYAPLTRQGTIIVDGIAASCYTNVDDHYLAHAAFLPVRVVDRLIPGAFHSSSLETYMDFIQYTARLLMDKKQFHGSNYQH